MVDYFDSRTPQNRPRSLLGLSRPWGSFDYPVTSAEYFGRGVIRLIVFRPGITTAERRWARVWCWLVHRDFGMALAVVGGLLGVWALHPMPIWLRLVIVGAVAIALMTMLWVKTRTTLAAARGVRIRAEARRDGPVVVGDIALLEEATNRLLALDTHQLTPAEYEARWGEIYDWLGSFRTSTTTGAQR